MLKDQLAQYTPEYLESLSIPELEKLSSELYELPKPIREIRIAIGGIVVKKVKDEQVERMAKMDPDLAAAFARKAQSIEGDKVDSEEKVNSGS